MSSNRLAVIQGTTNAFVIDLTDVAGDPLPVERLTGAAVSFVLRVQPTDSSNVLAFQTPDPAHLVLDANASTLAITLSVSDSNITLGPYFYQIELTLSDGEVVVPIQWTPCDVTLGGSAAPTPPPFTNTLKLDENYGLPGNLSYFTPGGSPIVNAQIRIYLKSDFDAGKLTAPVGISSTNIKGGWATPVFVQPGYSYVISFFKPYEFGPDNRTIVGV